MPGQSGTGAHDEKTPCENRETCDRKRQAPFDIRGWGEVADKSMQREAASRVE